MNLMFSFMRVGLGMGVGGRWYGFYRGERRERRGKKKNRINRRNGRKSWWCWGKAEAKVEDDEMRCVDGMDGDGPSLRRTSPLAAGQAVWMGLAGWGIVPRGGTWQTRMSAPPGEDGEVGEPLVVMG